mmetsp:Transcript_71773/g.112272  ORF Transcript_71773/g.112272 Transcript_71773/m.112272 type:complete len:235 (-) Transcript_71773:284-988(-)
MTASRAPATLLSKLAAANSARVTPSSMSSRISAAKCLHVSAVMRACASNRFSQCPRNSRSSPEFSPAQSSTCFKALRNVALLESNVDLRSTTSNDCLSMIEANSGIFANCSKALSSTVAKRSCSPCMFICNSEPALHSISNGSIRSTVCNSRHATSSRKSCNLVVIASMVAADARDNSDITSSLQVCKPPSFLMSSIHVLQDSICIWQCSMRVLQDSTELCAAIAKSRTSSSLP